MDCTLSVCYYLLIKEEFDVIGDIIKELRLSSKYTQEDLAQKLKISKSTIGMYEQNRRSPDLDTLVKISKIFSVSTDYLLGLDSIKKDTFASTYSWEDFTKIFPDAIRLTNEQRDILTYYDQLSLTDKRWIMGQMIDLIKKAEESTSIRKSSGAR